MNTLSEDKAKELISKFTGYFPLMLHKEKVNPLVKQCAIIALDEIMYLLNGDGKSLDINAYWNGEKFVGAKETKEYFQEVKEHIQNIK